VTTTGAGRCWQGPDFRLLHVPDVAGRRDDGRLGSGAVEQADLMFANADAALRAHGFTFRSVVRTWIYLRRILEWYGDFNRVRTAFFTAQGVGMDPERSFPASTGIQGNAAGEECRMDLLAVEGSGAVMAPVHTSSRQGRSFDYGSAFSRAMRLRIGGLDTVLVSGTASIDTAGNTLHHDNPEAQIRETLDCIFALLDIQGGKPEDIVQATLFCKDPDFLAVYRRVMEREPAAAHPAVPVLADICRPDLLVEIEAIAVVPAPPGGHAAPSNPENLQ
jgi:enamine deaminase RidA (YjgF/YER057c/UK114 family)